MTKEEREERRYRDQNNLEWLLERASEVAEADLNRKARATTTTAAREQLFLSQFEEAATRIFKNKIVAPKYQHKAKKETERLVNLLISDTHFHSLLDPNEVPIEYGPVQEARRLAAVCAQAADYKPHYRAETELNVYLDGDIIQGQLHDARDGAPMAAQSAAAMYLLTQAIVFLASQYKKVRVYCSPGNHGRNTARHKERATNQKWDAIETMIYYGIKNGCRSLQNVQFFIPKTPFFTYTAFDQKGFGTHGDTVLEPGFPGSNINVANLRKQINEINAAEGRRTGSEFSLFFTGHVHTGAVVVLPGGVVVVTNGALIPVDPYAESRGMLDSACGQTLWESVPGHIFGDYRFLTVDQNTDKDSKLDLIIKPFTGFDD